MSDNQAYTKTFILEPQLAPGDPERFENLPIAVQQAFKRTLVQAVLFGSAVGGFVGVAVGFIVGRLV